MFAIEDVEQDIVELVVALFFRIIFDDDVFQFSQFGFYLIVLAGKSGDVVIWGQFTFQQFLYVGEYRFVFILHVSAYFLGIFIKEFQDEIGYIVGSRTVDGFDEFAADDGQLEIEEIGMCLFQILHQCGDGKGIFIIGVCILFFADEVGYGKESAVVYICLLYTSDAADD